MGHPAVVAVFVGEHKPKFHHWETVPYWRIAGLNPPKDRGKRGRRRKVGKGAKRSYDRLHKNAGKPWPCGHRNNKGK